MKKLLLTFSLIALSSTINAQWVSQGTGFSVASRGLSEIKIVDANTVWALAYDGSAPTPPATTNPSIQEMTLTTDGGGTWNSKTINIGDPLLEINNISPVSGTTAWLSALIPADGNGVIYKTTDGGDNWTQQLANGFQTTGDSFLNGVYFWNANEGVAYGDPTGTGSSRKFEIYRTTDGGNNWTAVTGANLPVALASEYGYNNSPIVVGNTIWMTTSKGRLFRSSDKGATWVAYQTPIADFGGYSTPGTSGNAHFSDVNKGCLLRAVGTTTPVYTFYTTTNGGQTWSAGTTFTGTRKILNYIPGTNTIVATSQATPVGTSISTDNGTTWTDLEPTGVTQRGASAFLSASIGWCAGFSGTDPFSDGIFKLTGPLANQSITKAKFSVYPNPASSNVTIAATDVDSFNLSVTDITGKIVLAKSLNGMENTVDISALSSGAYFFTLSSDNKKEVVKILKN
ncbi:T9SS type A sorting domain-containing protein [Flavobacterium sp. N1994]|uniref:T9SS type A sorting domain-containing protein n=1 Tax=Flavobacterium sp. N1994 TaxID=2986827 RepID=UPI0022216ABB|nr:T9SS type A sorting domain-containing protein [Flavobacterium sp. N1994]